MKGTRVTATDLDTGESDSIEIRDNHVLICDGRAYLAHEARHANGTTVLTIKLRVGQQ